jgi:5-methylthioribose kinase
VFELSTANAAAYIGEPCTARELGGGVSNTVLLVETGSSRFVVKQALPKLRVEQDWFCERDRIFREAEALRMLAPMLPPDAVPAVLLEDRENFAFRMTAAPPYADTWKAKLLRGDVDLATAEATGCMLGRMIRGTWRSASFGERFGDRTVFDQLRLDPYYRTVAKRHPDLAPAVDALIETTLSRQHCLVHGDWSPKNFLVSDQELMAIDFEVAHFGDPSFDAAFMLNHLLLKSFFRPEFRQQYCVAARRFWNTLETYTRPLAGDWFEPATLQHLGGLLLARIDGKSPAEYITDPDLKQRIRAYARTLITNSPAAVAEVFRW